MWNRKIAFCCTAIFIPFVLSEPVFAQIKFNGCATIDAGKEGQSAILTRRVNTSGTCLTINADNVTVDLRGFTIKGDGTGTGIDVNADGVTIRNGTIKDFLIGVDLSGADDTVVENLKVFNAPDGGIAGFGGLSGTVIRNNLIEGSERPIDVGSDCIVTGNIVRDIGSVVSTGFGIQTDSRCLIEGNIVSGELVAGGTMGGIETGDDAIVKNNTVTLMDGNGIVTGNGSTIVHNTVGKNAAGGIVVTCPSNVIGNTAIFNGSGPGAGVNLVLAGLDCNDSENVAP